MKTILEIGEGMKAFEGTVTKVVIAPKDSDDKERTFNTEQDNILGIDGDDDNVVVTIMIKNEKNPDGKVKEFKYPWTRVKGVYVEDTGD